jgi:hypothetical protein
MYKQNRDMKNFSEEINTTQKYRGKNLAGKIA